MAQGGAGPRAQPPAESFQGGLAQSDGAGLQGHPAQQGKVGGISLVAQQGQEGHQLLRVGPGGVAGLAQGRQAEGIAVGNEQGRQGRIPWLTAAPPAQQASHGRPIQVIGQDRHHILLGQNVAGFQGA
jgi:hypothetical protein